LTTPNPARLEAEDTVIPDAPPVHPTTPEASAHPPEDTALPVTWTRQSKERDVPDCQHKGHQRQDDCERHKYVVDRGRCL